MGNTTIRELYISLILNILDIQCSKEDREVNVINNFEDKIIYHSSARELFVDIFCITVSMLEKKKCDISEDGIIKFWKGEISYKDKELIFVQNRIKSIYMTLKDKENYDNFTVEYDLLDSGFPIYKQYLNYLKGNVLEIERKKISKMGVDAKQKGYNEIKKYAKKLYMQKKKEDPKYSKYKFAKNNWQKVEKFAKENNLKWNATDKELSITRMLKKIDTQPG